MSKCVGTSTSGPAHVMLEDGEELGASGGLVVAVEGPEASTLLGEPLAKLPSKPEPGVGTCCLYFR